MVLGNSSTNTKDLQDSVRFFDKSKGSAKGTSLGTYFGSLKRKLASFDVHQPKSTLPSFLSFSNGTNKGDTENTRPASLELQGLTERYSLTQP